MKPATRVARSDLDPTLLPIDSDHRRGVSTQAIGWADPVEFRHRHEDFCRDRQAGMLDVQACVRSATDAFRRKGEATSLASRQRFMTEGIRPQGLVLARHHQRADHPLATNPDKRLCTIATRRGWRILDLFPPHP